MYKIWQPYQKKHLVYLHSFFLILLFKYVIDRQPVRVISFKNEIYLDWIV